MVLVGADKFYFTNDHGNTSKVGVFFENYMGLKASGVVYHDGTSYSDVAGDIAYANGINVSPDLKKLYVAAPRQFEVLEYDISTDGSLDGPKVITTGTGVDNLEWDDAGNLWSGAHPNLIAFTTYASLKADSAPSEVVKIKFPDVSVESVYVDDGSQISASSVAVPYTNFLFIGNVLDDRLLVLRK